MFDVVTFGEAMIRLSPPHFERLEQANSLDLRIGGGELNVAVGVSRLGLRSTWVSRLPKNALGKLMENRVRQAGVDTSNLVWSADGRVGLYFLEFGAAPRASSVLYDRAQSAISAVKPGEIPEVGRGTTFRLELPLARAVESPAGKVQDFGRPFAEKEP